MRKSLYAFFVLLLFTSCVAPTPSPTLFVTLTPFPTQTRLPTHTTTNTPTSTATSTITPTNTPNPFTDTDSDGYITENEQIWGTDPFTFTSFEELSYHPGTIYAKMRVSQPFDIDDMNGTVYQVVKPIEVQDNGTPNYSNDDHLVFEVILFPYANYKLTDLTTRFDTFPIEPSNYPEDVQLFLESTEKSNMTTEMQDTLLEVVKNAKSDVEAISKILDWNYSNFLIMKDPVKGFYYYYELLDFQAGDMFHYKEKRWSTTESTILAAELRAVGIPARITFSVFVTMEPSLKAFAHPSNQVFLNGRWVKLDYTRGFNYSADSYRDQYNYDYLAITDIYRDCSEADWQTWIYIVDYYGDKPPKVYFTLHEPIEFREN